jgi:cupin superfamily acireductone dioxygenase involved in methionine salvage
MGENGSYLAVWAGWQHRFVAKENNGLSGFRVSQAAPEWLTAGGLDLNDWIP